MATTTLYTRWDLDEFDSGVATVAPILKTGTAVDNSLVAAVQASALANLGHMLATTAGGAPSPVPTPFAVPTWAANVQYGAGQGVMSPTGVLLVRVAAGVSRSTFDATEAALWTQDGSAAYAAVGATSVAGIQSTMQKIHTQAEDVHILSLGDSIDAGQGNWFGRLAAYIAGQWPLHTVKYQDYDSSATQNWAAFNTVQTGTNGCTIWFHNGSVGGQTTGYPTGVRMAQMVGAIQPDLILTSYCANDDRDTAANAFLFADSYAALTESILLASPGSAIVFIGKPGKPLTPGAIEYRTDRVKQLVRTKGFGFIDVYQAFLAADPNWATDLIQVDGIHPTTGVNTVPPSGQDVYLYEVQKHFVWLPNVQMLSGQSASSLAVPIGRNLVLNGDFSTFTGATPANWTNNGNVTCSKDTTTWFEKPQAWGVRCVPTAAGAGILSQTVDLTNGLQGQWIGCALRVRMPPTAPTPQANGLVQLLDGTTDSLAEAVHSPGVTEQDGMRWVFCSILTNPAATTLTVNMIPFLEGAPGDESTQQRIIVAKGRLPRDVY